MVEQKRQAGYRIRLLAFVPVNPNKPAEMAAAASAVDAEKIVTPDGVRALLEIPGVELELVSAPQFINRVREKPNGTVQAPEPQPQLDAQQGDPDEL